MAKLISLKEVLEKRPDLVTNDKMLNNTLDWPTMAEYNNELDKIFVDPEHFWREENPEPAGSLTRPVEQVKATLETWNGWVDTLYIITKIPSSSHAAFFEGYNFYEAWAPDEMWEEDSFNTKVLIGAQTASDEVLIGMWYD